MSDISTTEDEAAQELRRQEVRQAIEQRDAAEFLRASRVEQGDERFYPAQPVQRG